MRKAEQNVVKRGWTHLRISSILSRANSGPKSHVKWIKILSFMGFNTKRTL